MEAGQLRELFEHSLGTASAEAALCQGEGQQSWGLHLLLGRDYICRRHSSDATTAVGHSSCTSRRHSRLSLVETLGLFVLQAAAHSPC